MNGPAQKIKRVLLVEDEALSALNLKRELEALGYEVLPPAATGERAVALAAEHGPDVIVMDINLPGSLNGTDAARKITARKNIPVIFMTGYDDDRIRNQMDGIPSLGCLVKPVLPEQIDAVIRRHFG